MSKIVTHQGPFLCLLLVVSSDYAQPITDQVTEITCPLIGRAQSERTPSKRQKMGPGAGRYIASYGNYQKQQCHGDAMSCPNFHRLTQCWLRSIGSSLKGFNLLRQLQYIPRNMHTVFALPCFVVIIHWLIFPYPSGLLHWHCGNLTIAPVPAKQPWWIWINTSCEFIINDCITTTKQSTTKPCAYFLGYTVSIERW